MSRLIKAQALRNYRDTLITSAEEIYGKPHNWCCLTMEQKSEFCKYIKALRDITDQFSGLSTEDLETHNIKWPEPPLFISTAPKSFDMNLMGH